MPRTIPRLHTGNDTIDRLQDEIREAVRELANNPLTRGRLLEGVTLTTGQANVIGHKLHRTPRGVLLVMSNAQADIWVPSKSNKVLDVRTSATITANLWVF